MRSRWCSTIAVCWAPCGLILAASALGGGLAGCNLDDRRLVLATPGAAGDAGGGGAPGGSVTGGAAGHAGGPGGEGGAAGAGETAGAAGSLAGGAGGAGGSAGFAGGTPIRGGAGGEAGRGGEATTGPCIDADANGVPDCEQAWLLSATFDLETADWTTEASVAALWDPLDAGADPLSGSLRVTNTAVAESDGATMAGVTLCVPATASLYYRLFVRTVVDGDVSTDGALASLWFFESVDCTGALAGAVSSAQQGPALTWSVLSSEGSAPARTQSARIRLAVIKRFRGEPATARFDDVRLKQL